MRFLWGGWGCCVNEDQDYIPRQTDDAESRDEFIRRTIRETRERLRNGPEKETK